jgi:hypothetical protein
MWTEYLQQMSGNSWLAQRITAFPAKAPLRRILAFYRPSQYFCVSTWRLGGQKSHVMRDVSARRQAFLSQVSRGFSQFLKVLRSRLRPMGRASGKVTRTGSHFSARPPWIWVSNFLVTCPHNTIDSSHYTIEPWRWRQHVLPNRQYPLTEMRGVTTERTTIWTIASVKTSELNTE